MKTTIFYENSFGFLSQWKGEVIAKDEKSITIKFSKNKAFKYNLKALDIDFCLVTKTPVKDLGVCISKTSEAICFDEDLKQFVLNNVKDNIQYFWNNGKWE